MKPSEEISKYIKEILKECRQNKPQTVEIRPFLSGGKVNGAN